MRIALVYPPPWKIAGPTEPGFGADGPPDGYREGDLDGDFYQTPYGLFTIAAQAMRAGHQVKVLNLSAYRWRDVEEVIGSLDADVFGMSCWTANRRGVGLTAELMRRRHPKACIVVGGPHASPLPKEMLEHHPAIDVVTSSESDITFLEIAERHARGESFTGLPGATYRGPRGIEKGPPRELVHDLDSLASPHHHFDTHILMTSRGCPWACTFCGAESQWGRGFRGNSVGYVLDALESSVARLPVKMVMIKDDTFTTQKKRVVELCRGIRERGLKFVWSCDTRVDLLTDELLHEMRLAGCARLSLGVESGAPEILKQVDKKITVDDILESTELAKKWGIKLRYYMMLGNRGETEHTFRQTLDFLAQAKPHEYIFSCLSIYPGTRDFQEAEQAGWLDRELYFQKNFQELKIPYDASEAATRMMNDWFAGHAGLQVAYRESLAEEKAILARLGDFAPAHLDVAGAAFEAGEVAEAERHARRALELGHPLPGLCYNYLACAAVAKNDYDAMMDLYSEAAKKDPQHPVLIRNVNAARAWFKRGGPSSGPLRLEAQHDFRVLERTAQPTLPGPLPADFATWEPATEPAPAAEPTVARVGSQLPLRDRKSLKVM
jgi:anaerobic magnesium-protoporphyrin IX monomethyl ester cyclase